MNKSLSLILFILNLRLFPFTKSYENKAKLNTSNPVNISFIKEKIKIYEKEYIDLFIKSSKNEELFCEKIKNNIKSFQEIKNRYSLLENDISKGLINNIEFKEFLDTIGDISFSIRNLEIIIKKLYKKEKSCVHNNKEFENIKNDLKVKSKKSKENIIKNINHILKINNDL